MKYAIIIPDGRVESTASGRRKTPSSRPAEHGSGRPEGNCGRSNGVPQLTPASDVATLSLFGYDPLAVYTGAAEIGQGLYRPN